jgi:replicative DNA helicase
VVDERGDSLWDGIPSSPEGLMNLVPPPPYEPNEFEPITDEQLQLWLSLDSQERDDGGQDAIKAAATRMRIAARAQEQYVELVARESASERRAAELIVRARELSGDHARVVDGADFLFDVPSRPPSIWGDGDDVLWCRGEALMIAGPQGVGKTGVGGQLIRALLGLAGDVLGFPIAPAIGRVLYLAMDRPEQARRSLARMYSPDDREKLRDRLRFWTGPPPADFAASPEALVNMAREHCAEYVLIDSIKDAAVGLSKDEVGAGYNRARQLALSCGIQLVELHHMVKSGRDGGPPRTLADVYGSTWLTAGVGSVLLLWGDAGDPVVELSQLKSPIAEIAPMQILHDRGTGLSRRFNDPDRDVVLLARACGAAGITIAQAAKAMFGADSPSSAQKEKARRHLNSLTEKGLLVALPGIGGSGHAAGTTWLAGARPDDQGASMNGWGETSTALDRLRGTDDIPKRYR